MLKRSADVYEHRFWRNYTQYYLKLQKENTKKQE